MHKEEIFKQIVESASRVVVVGHANPDGDALGSMSALNQLFKSFGKEVSMVVPNELPQFIDFLRFDDRVLVYKHDKEEVNGVISDADLIICVDFNDITTRIGDIGEEIEFSSAQRIMIDHHQAPNTDGFELVISEPSSSSTAFLVYRTMERAGWFERLSLEGCMALYAGMITDTGNFAYSNISPELMRAAADLIERGVDSVALYNKLYNSQSENRMRLMAHLLSQKMVILKEHGAAYITFSLAEQKRFNYSTGDVEGVVNMPLAIDGVSVSAIFVETTDFVKLSLRSLAGGVDVNKMARENFTGGGHINAAGAKSFTTIDNSVAKFISALEKL